MPAYRFFAPELNPNLILSEKEQHHAKHVMKLQQGDNLELIDGKGGLAKGKITSHKKKETFVVCDSITRHSPPAKGFSLAQGFCQDKKKMHLIIEKACELGCQNFYYFCSDRGAEEKQVATAHKKFVEIAIGALKQSGNLFLPAIKPLASLQALCSLPYSLFYGSLDSKALPLIHSLPAKKPPLLVVGPEPGFSLQELDKLQQIGAKSVCLSAYTLRSETAAIVGMGILSHTLLATS